MKSLLFTLLVCSITTFAFSQSSIGVNPPAQKTMPDQQIDALSSYLSPLYVPGNKIPPTLKNFTPDDHVEITLEGDFGSLVTESYTDRMPMLAPEGDYNMPVVAPGDSTKTYTLLRKRIE